MAAAGGDLDAAKAAFGQLYSDYWYPLYAFARRRGASPEDAGDLTQDFFVHLLEDQSLSGLEKAGGRFRSFLLRAFENFRIGRYHQAQAQKRGGGVPTIPLDVVVAERKLSGEPADSVTPEVDYTRRWALNLLNIAFEKLRVEQEAGSPENAALFAELFPLVQGDTLVDTYAEIAGRYGTTEGAIKVKVLRLRQRYREVLRREIARTVETSEEVDAELDELIRVLGATA